MKPKAEDFCGYCGKMFKEHHQVYSFVRPACPVKDEPGRFHYHYHFIPKEYEECQSNNGS